MKNLYEILEIEKNATKKDITKIYEFLKIKYTIEDAPDKLHEVWKAYSVLKNKKRKNSYDLYCSCDKNIRDMELEAEKMLENKDYEQAEKNLRKIIDSTTDILIFQEKLCEVLFKRKKYKEAFTLMENLIKLNPTSSDYYLLYGNMHEELGHNISAINSYIKALELDPENYDATTSLINLYIWNNNLFEAISYLKNNICYTKNFRFRDFFNMCKLIECYIIKDDEKAFKEMLNNIVIPDSNHYKRYVICSFIKLALQMIDSHHELWALHLIKFKEQLCESKTQKSNTEYNKNVYISMENFIKNCKNGYFPIIATVLTSEQHDENGILKIYREKNFNIILQDFNSLDEKKLTSIEYTLNLLKEHYPNLYALRKEFFDILKKGIKHQIKTAQEYKEFALSRCFINPIKECVIAIEQQDDDLFQNGLNLFMEFSTYEIKTSLDYFSDYPLLKERYSEFISALRDKCKELDKLGIFC